MKGFEKYQKTYFMPSEATYDWVKKDSITEPPVWCSVDLRDGNQALIEPMSEDRIQGNRGWIPCCIRDRIQFSAYFDRSEADPG